MPLGQKINRTIDNTSRRTRAGGTLARLKNAMMGRASSSGRGG